MNLFNLNQDYETENAKSLLDSDSYSCINVFNYPQTMIFKMTFS